MSKDSPASAGPQKPIPRPDRALVITMAVMAVALVAGLIYLGDRQPRARITLERLETLKTAVTAYTKTNGAPPKVLSDLGLPSEALQDHIGEPFHYSVLVDGTVSIVSRGLDKEPGGLMFHKDYKVEFDPRSP